MRLFLLIGLCGLFSFSKAQTIDTVMIIPGKGIILNNDSILLGKTILQNILTKFKNLKEPESIISAATGFDSLTNEPFSEISYEKELVYKSMVFGFYSNKRNGNFELSYIQITKDNSIWGFINKNLKLGTVNPKIVDDFPLQGQLDYISNTKDSYHLNSYGLTIELTKIDNNLEVNKIIINEIWK